MTLNRIWTIGAIVVIIGVLVLAWIGGVSPKLAEAQDDATQQQSVESSNAEQTAALAQLKGQYSSLPALEEKLAQLQISIPGLDGINEFVQLLNAYATSSGADVTSVSIDSAVVTPVAAPATTSTATPAATATAAPPAAPAAPESGSQAVTPAGVLTFTVEIQASGSRGQLLDLVSDLQTFGRLFLVNNFVLTTTSQSTTATIDGVVYEIPNPAGLPTDLPTAVPTNLPKAAPLPTNTAIPTGSPTPTGTPNP